MSSIKFLNPRKTDFYKVVSQRVEDYFTQKGISPNADYRMVVKTTFMFSLYIIPYILILFHVGSIYVLWLYSAIMGLGLAGIGMSVMHDANHGAYSNKRWLNRLLGYSLDFVGGNSFNWKIQHNVQHHTYTNIHGHDFDIRDRMNLRFTPSVKLNFWHRFQVVYAFALYGLQTFFWVLLKDFVQVFEFGRDGLDKQDKTERIKRFIKLIGAKVLYIIYIFIIPVVIVQLSFWQVFVGFLTLHAVAGLILTTVFQLAHVVEDAHFPELDAKGNIQEEWAIHQMQTTADFAPKNKLVTFYVGGLNYQIEHHLFQRICHVHYPAIAPIVQQTAKEYGIPYLCNNTFGEALASHLKLLRTLGVKETLAMASEF